MARRLTLEDRNLLSKRFVAVREDESVAIAVDRFCRGEQPETLYCYVVDAGQRLVGVLPLRQLLAGPRAAPAGQLAVRNVVALRYDADATVVQDFFLTYRLLSFPVLDGEGRLIGIVPADKLADSYAELLDREHEDRVRASVLARLSLPDDVHTLGPLARGGSPWSMAYLLAAVLAGAVAVAVWQRIPGARGATLLLGPGALLGAGMAHRAAVLAFDRDDPPSRRAEVVAGMLLALPAGLLALVAGLALLPPRAVVLATIVATIAAPAGAAIGSAAPGALEASGRSPAQAGLVAVVAAVFLLASLHAALAFLLFS